MPIIFLENIMYTTIKNNKTKQCIAATTSYVPKRFMRNVFFERRIEKIYHSHYPTSKGKTMRYSFIFNHQNLFHLLKCAKVAGLLTFTPLKKIVDVSSRNYKKTCR